jgi:hypothetical protein
MLSMLRSLLRFRIGQKSSRGVARVLGFGRLSMIIGLIGGFRYMRRHSH